MPGKRKYPTGDLSEVVRLKLLPEQKKILSEYVENTGGTFSGIIRNMIEREIIQPYLADNLPALSKLYKDNLPVIQEYKEVNNDK